MAETIEQDEEEIDDVATFNQIKELVEDYADWIGDERLLKEYEKLLKEEPWTECDCEICREYGIEVAIFRGNNRNRRRGFHNTKRFYDQFQEDLPKTLVVTPATDAIAKKSSIEGYFLTEHTDFWSSVHDLPVAEVGVISETGVHEWWADAPASVSLDSDAMAVSVGEFCARYQNVFLYDPEETIHRDVVQNIEQHGCAVESYERSQDLRAAVLDRLGYDSEFVPEFMVQKGLMEF
ncbi:MULTISPECIES: hypothetical protein [Natrialbaceae]|nr:hypothetical protein [Natronococcus sp. CG52]